MGARSINKKLKQIEESVLNKESPYAMQIIREKDKQIRYLVIAIVLIVAGFLLYLNQYDFVSQDGSGINIVGDNNQEVTNGSES